MDQIPLFEQSKYKVIEELGRGGMGIVYKVFVPHMNSFFALKTILAKTENRDVQRFVREARAMAKMSNPHIVRVYDIGIISDIPYFTMDYVEGVSLGTFLKSASLDIRFFSKLMIKISNAIAYAHKQGVIHRDLKPDNILLDKNLEPYVMDFGLVKLVEVDSSLSKTGYILGTPRYVATASQRQKRGPSN